MKPEDITLICVENTQAVDVIDINESRVELSGPVFKLIVNEGTFFVREGTWFEKDEQGEFQADWSLTWIYKKKDDPEDYTYYEQGTKETAVYNFLKSLEDKK